ncbi:MAG: hypothetical protein R3E01_32450 [Pirellulaceae bacterium]|nr:hypothetical protein [Planctomycetales bacterium]
MATAATLPSSDHIAHLLSGLYGDVAVTEAKTPIDTSAAYTAAAYIDDENIIQRLIVCDVAFANFAGAALTMVPPAIANDGVKSGQVAPNIQENLSEVFNICVNVFSDHSKQHLKLGSVVFPGGPIDETVAAAISASSDRTEFVAKIPRYGTGQIALLAK